MNGATTAAAPAANGSTSAEKPAPPIFTRKGVPIVVPKGPETANNTLYVRNLNEKKSVHYLRRSLQRLFEQFGAILEIHCNKGIRKRGQAWIVFRRTAAAQEAIKELQHHVMDGKPMFIQYAESRSDAVAKKDSSTFEEHRKQRREHKAQKDAEYEAKKKAKQEALAALADKAGAATGGAAPPSAPVIPDELLPPNAILFVQNLPSGTGADVLTELFEKHAGFVEVRLVPSKTDIAFVEYDTEANAGLARVAMNGFVMHGADGDDEDNVRQIRVTYARK
ncbi:hypothetical protein RI367_004696 [Sorochytrium milnesiophthora]